MTELLAFLLIVFMSIVGVLLYDALMNKWHEKDDDPMNNCF